MSGEGAREPLARRAPEAQAAQTWYAEERTEGDAPWGWHCPSEPAPSVWNAWKPNVPYDLPPAE